MASRVGRGITLPFLDRGIRRGEWSAARPNRNLPPGKTRYPLYRMLGGPQGQSGRAENLASPGFDPRTVQPVAQSLYRLSYRAPTYIIHPRKISISCPGLPYLPAADVLRVSFLAAQVKSQVINPPSPAHSCYWYKTFKILKSGMTKVIDAKDDVFLQKDEG
jgi:hypothetical protein